jgi:hypothetical protein
MSSIRVLNNVSLYNSITATSSVRVPEIDGFNNQLILKPNPENLDDRYLIVEPTGPSDIHIRAGGISDESYANLRLGGEYNHVEVSDNGNSISFNTAKKDTEGTWYSNAYGNGYPWRFKTEEIVDGSLYKHTFYLPYSAHIGQDDGIATWHGTINFTGNLNVAGSATFHNTDYTTTSSISVTNTGTGPALIVNQTGEEAIAAFYDDNSIALYIDGKTGTNGYVGIGTSTPNEKLTVVGNISATGTIIGSSTIQKVVSAFGNGTDTLYEVLHNLGTEDVVVSIIDTATKEVVYPSVVNYSLSSIKIEFAIAPTSNAYKAVIIG